MAEEVWASKKNINSGSSSFVVVIWTASVLLCSQLLWVRTLERTETGRGIGLVPNTWCRRPQWGNTEAGGEQGPVRLGRLGCGEAFHSRLWCPTGGANSRIPGCPSVGLTGGHSAWLSFLTAMGAPGERRAWVPSHTVELSWFRPILLGSVSQSMVTSSVSPQARCSPALGSPYLLLWNRGNNHSLSCLGWWPWRVNNRERMQNVLQTLKPWTHAMSLVLDHPL